MLTSSRGFETCTPVLSITLGHHGIDHEGVFGCVRYFDGPIPGSGTFTGPPLSLVNVYLVGLHLGPAYIARLSLVNVNLDGLIGLTLINLSLVRLSPAYLARAIRLNLVNVVNLDGLISLTPIRPSPAYLARLVRFSPKQPSTDDPTLYGIPTSRRSFGA